MKKKMKVATILAFAVLGMILLMSILAPLIAPYDPDVYKRQFPVWRSAMEPVRLR